jgi:steroid 5-alpha reductase family enzyme
MNQLIQFLFPALVVTLFLMTAFWLWGKSRDNYGVIDVGWGVVIASIVGVYWFHSEMSFLWKSILAGMVLAWGLRLSLFLLFTRILTNHPEDKRYHAFRKDYGDKVHQKFFTNVFLFQGLLALILTGPLLSFFLEDSIDFPILIWIGLLVFCIGQLGETFSDQQLSRFVQDPKNRGEVCKKGFWKYSRHPNYFFEWVIWLGVSLAGCSASWIAILPAVFMYVLLVHVTGVPFAEKYSLQSKGDKFREYQRTTNAFFPWFPKV